MRGTVALLCLESRPGVDPDAHGGGPGGEGGFGGDAEAVGEGGDAGLRSGEDSGVVREGRAGRPVFEESGVRILEVAEL